MGINLRAALGKLGVVLELCFDRRFGFLSWVSLTCACSSFGGCFCLKGGLSSLGRVARGYLVRFFSKTNSLTRNSL